MDQKILCISGRKQAGKDTCYKFLESLATSWHSEQYTNGDGSFGSRPIPPIGAIGQFYYAQALKRMCVDILGCPEDKVFGTDADKNTLVPHLLWENFPVPVFDRPDGTVYVHSQPGLVMPPTVFISTAQDQYQGDKIVPVPIKDGFGYYTPGIALPPDAFSSVRFQETPPAASLVRKQGPMSVREVLQYWGTEVFRRQYQNVWADACIRSIRKSGVGFAVITDCRFPNEVEAAHAAGGRVVRLTRVLHPEDTHASETSLDADKYDWGVFDAIIRNEEMSIHEQCFSLYRTLVDWGWLPEMPPELLRKHYERAAA